MRSAMFLFMQFFAFTIVYAQDFGCGHPPPVENETIERDIKGKAQIVSKYLGDAELSGKIKTSRTEIFSKYPDAEKSRANAFFEYQVCVFLMNDRKMSPQEKINELIKIRREFNKPVSIAYPVILSAREPWIDNRKIGMVRASSSTIEILIDDKQIVSDSLDEPTRDHVVSLEAGDHSFSFNADITFHEGIVNDTCRGTLTVKGPMTVRPLIIFYKRSVDGQTRGFIEDCQLRQR